MNRRYLVITAGLLLAAAALPGQDNGDARRRVRVDLNSWFGQVNWLSPDALNRPIDEGFGSRVITGRPFSATEERHFLQVLGDGTRIETNETNKLYRDTQGRTRTEGQDGKATIVDPVAGFRVELDPAARTARYQKYTVLAGAFDQFLRQQQSGTLNRNGVRSETAEGLGSQTLNGVTARGERLTQTIPAGEIGNDREIKIVNERWVSENLQMLIKSTNSDPRFGDTTYELTNITQREPDAALFQVPSGYAEVSGPGRAGGRGGARGGAPGGRGGRGPGKQP